MTPEYEFKSKNRSFMTSRRLTEDHLCCLLTESGEMRRWEERPGKNGGYPNFASDVSCVPGCRGDSVARHSSFKTWSRLGVGDRLRGSHLDQDQVSLSSQPPVFPGLHKLYHRAESGSPRDSVQPRNQATQSRSLTLGLSPVLG